MGFTAYVTGWPAGALDDAAFEEVERVLDARVEALKWGCETPCAERDNEEGCIKIWTKLQQADGDAQYDELVRCAGLALLVSKITPKWLWEVRDDLDLLETALDAPLWIQDGRAIAVTDGPRGKEARAARKTDGRLRNELERVFKATLDRFLDPSVAWTPPDPTGLAWLTVRDLWVPKTRRRWAYPASAALVSPDGHFVATSSSEDRSLRIWSVADDAVRTHPLPGYLVGFFGDDAIALSTDGGVGIYGVTDGVRRGPPRSAAGAAISEDGSTLMWGRKENVYVERAGTVRKFEPPKFDDPLGSFLNLFHASSRDGRRILVGYNARGFQLAVLDVETGTYPFRRDTRAWNDEWALSPSGQWIAYTDDRSMGYIASVDTGEVRCHLPGEKVRSEAYRGGTSAQRFRFLDEDHLLVHYIDLGLGIWDLGREEVEFIVRPPFPSIRDIEVSTRHRMMVLRMADVVLIADF